MDWRDLNPDEVDLLFGARLARYSPTPFSTWITGTTGPYWTYLLLGLNALGAPMTLAFSHLLAAAITGVMATVLFTVIAREVDRRLAALFAICWWFPLAAIFPIGIPTDFGALSTEYLPMALIVLSALVTRNQLAQRPWLFAVIGLLAGLAVGSKFQAAPVALAFLIAQLIVMKPTVGRCTRYVAWWLLGVATPFTALVVAIWRSKATNWVLIEQTLSFLRSYSGSEEVSLQEKLLRTGTAFIAPSLYLLVLGGIVAFLAGRSNSRSNVARSVLIAGGLIAVLIGGHGFPHYLIFVFGTVGLVVSMPVLPQSTLVSGRVPSVRVLQIITLIAVTLISSFGYRAGLWRPLPPRMAAAALSPESVITNPTLSRYCPPDSRALVWGWASEFAIAQNWTSTIPYPNIYGIAIDPGIRKSAEPVFRHGIESARCILDATNLARSCPPPAERPAHPIGFCLPPTVMLSKMYPHLWDVVIQEFRPVAITAGCDGCLFYVRSTGTLSSRSGSAPRRNEK